MTEQNPLAVIEKLPAQAIFGNGSDGSHLADILERIKQEVLKNPVDVTTKKGREDCASLAYKVARSKTFLDDMGKKQTEASRAFIASVNADRKKAVEFLDELRDQVRKPLNEYEAREKARTDVLKAQVAYIDGLVAKIAALTPDEDGLRGLDALEADEAYTSAALRDWAEFAPQAELARLRAGTAMREKRVAIKHEIEARIAAEQERVRKAEAERKEAERLRIEREKRIAEEAEAKAKQDAADAIARANAQAEKAKRDAEEAEKRRIEEAAHAEREAARIAAIEQKRREQAILEATQRAEAAAQEKARQEEQERLKAKEDAERIERARQQDKENRRKVNREALEDMALKFADLFDSEEAAQAAARTVLEAIIVGKIRHVTVNY